MAEMGQPHPAQGPSQQAREKALQLSKERKQVDAELQRLAELLRREGVNLTSPLVDRDGFPLNTVDIPTIRDARSKIIALQNDRKAIDAQLDQLLHVALAPSTDA
ncbi:unnamed protein product [Parajaminaea phylloscopi]